MTPCLSHNFPPMYLKRNTTTRLLNLRTLLCMQLLTYETALKYMLRPIRRTVRRVNCKKDTTLHNVLTYRVMPVWKYSHTRTCLCAMCTICFMTSVVFPRKYLGSVMFMHKCCSHTKRHGLCVTLNISHLVCHIISHRCSRKKVQHHSFFNLRTLLTMQL